jgi:hypothetical protein
MRKPNIAEMKHMLARDESENKNISDIYEMVFFGTKGYNDCTDDEIMEIFVKTFGANHIPTEEVK